MNNRPSLFFFAMLLSFTLLLPGCKKTECDKIRAQAEVIVSISNVILQEMKECQASGDCPEVNGYRNSLYQLSVYYQTIRAQFENNECTGQFPGFPDTSLTDPSVPIEAP